MFALPIAVFGQSAGIDLTVQGVVGIITGLACWLTRAVMAVMVIMVIYYGLQFMWAQGNPAKVTKAKESLMWGIVGILVIMGTYTIIATVGNAFNPGSYTNFIPIRC